jgi:hypothetical protein
MQNLEADAENYWEWVIGTIGDIKLDITRTHTQRRWQVDTVIFLIGDEREFSEPLIARLVSRLHEFVTGSVYCGRWDYRSGDHFDLVVVREFKNGSD